MISFTKELLLSTLKNARVFIGFHKIDPQSCRQTHDPKINDELQSFKLAPF